MVLASKALGCLFSLRKWGVLALKQLLGPGEMGKMLTAQLQGPEFRSPEPTGSAVVHPVIPLLTEKWVTQEHARSSHAGR